MDIFKESNRQGDLVDLKEVKEWIALLEKSSLKKLQWKKGDLELLLEKGSENERIFEKPSVVVSHHGEKTIASDVSVGKPEVKGTFITSPMVGTYYSTPAPDKPPFVKKGDRVSKDQIVCIVEAMKVMNEVKAGVNGTIVEVLCDHAQPVEFGTKLFRVE
jgi:acetyl-CoA carboxylase biotin carboxyl carrier protein